MADLKALYEAILNGDNKTAVRITKEALAEKMDPQVLVTKHMVSAMDEVGRRFEKNEYFIPELLIAARAMKESLALIKPLLVKTGAKPSGRVIIGTVKGDIHDIGKNLVASMLEGGGFEVIDIGEDVPPEKFVTAVKEKKPDILALSALLTTTMLNMKLTIDALKTAGVRGGVKILIGGAPITKKFTDEIGADGYSDNASGAVVLARTLIAAR
jgi:corrinoid protein of di/trimethylamine methyltransferase